MVVLLSLSLFVTCKLVHYKVHRPSIRTSLVKNPLIRNRCHLLLPYSFSRFYKNLRRGNGVGLRLFDLYRHTQKVTLYSFTVLQQ